MTELKKDASEKKTTPKDEEVEKKIDIRKELTPEEAQRLVDRENGVEPKETEKPGEKGEMARPGIKEGEIPDRYKSKTPEELVKLLDEKENYIQGRSDEIGELRQEVEKGKVLKAKVDEIEARAIKQSQQSGTVPKEPEEPTISDEDFYNDPAGSWKKVIDYNKKLKEYSKQYTNAVISPFRQRENEQRRNSIYKGLEDKYKDYPVKFDREKVQNFLNNNPQYFENYKIGAYEKAYHDISSKDFSENKTKSDEAIREQAKKEALEEIQTRNQAGSVGMGDLGSQPINPTGSAPEYDKARMEEDSEYRDQVIADMEKRNK